MVAERLLFSKTFGLWKGNLKLREHLNRAQILTLLRAALPACGYRVDITGNKLICSSTKGQATRSTPEWMPRHFLESQELEGSLLAYTPG